MCGIAGMIDLSGRRHAPRGVVAAMARAIVHRGPDEDGFLEEAGLELANRRLSIVGLADGKQPIANEDRTVWTVYNGELFDYPEKRSELEARGHKFRTHTDTELIPVVVAGDEDAEGSRLADGVDLGVHALLGVATALVEVEKGLVEDLLDGRSFQRGVVGHPRLVDVVAQEDDRRPPGQLAAPPRHQAQARLALGIRRSRVAQQDQAMVDLVVRHSGGLPLAPMERDLVAAGETADAEQEARAKPARDSSPSSGTRRTATVGTATSTPATSRSTCCPVWTRRSRRCWKIWTSGACWTRH